VELFRALGSLAEAPASDGGAIAEALELGALPDAASHSDLFDQQLPPYASVYLGPEGMLGGEARDRIAGFWRALDLTPPEESDHITTMLAFYARLGELEAEADPGVATAAWQRSRVAYLWEHLVSWLPMYLARVSDIGSPFYVEWADLLADALRSEAISLPEPDRLPLHLREAPAPVDPREEGLEAFERALLTPVRSGFILTRADLGRAARTLDLGLRLVERPRVLRTLFAQDSGATLDWLAAEADAWTHRHREWLDVAPLLAEFWTGRATRTSMLLGSLRDADP